MEINLKNNLGEISRLSEELERFGETEGLSMKTVLEINLALEELVTNIVSYGYVDNEEHRITINIEREGNRIRVKIEDDGIAFNPLDAPPPVTGRPLEELKPGGLGIHLVKQLSSEISYCRRDGHNTLVLLKDLANS